MNASIYITRAVSRQRSGDHAGYLSHTTTWAASAITDVALSYGQTHTTDRGIRRMASAEIQYQGMTAYWTYSPRLILNYETVRGNGVRERRFLTKAGNQGCWPSGSRGSGGLG